MERGKLAYGGVPLVRIAGVLIALMLAVGLNARVAQAIPITFTTSGTVPSTGDTVSASAEFTVLSGGNLQIVLTNTTSGGTLANGDALTDLFFTVIAADPVLAMSSATGNTLNPSATGVDLKAVNKGDGTWEFVGHPGSTFGVNENGVNFPYEYGLSTAGDGGLFNGDLIDGPDYHIVAAGTDLNLDGLKNFPAVDTSATFVISGYSGLTEANIRNVAFSFGTTPDLVSEGGGPPQQVIPEPTTVALLGIGLCGLLLGKRRKG